jgi:DNA-binding IclR family transcriptional regulator
MKKATGGAQSIRRAVAVLRILATGQERGVRLADVVAAGGLNRPTAHRILKVLAEEGAVEQDPETRRYLVGREVSLLGLARGARSPVRAAAEPYLSHLAEQLGDTVFLTVRSGADTIGVDRKMGAYPVQVRALDIGARRPLGVGVAGVMLLACLPEREAEDLVRANAQRLVQYQLTAARLLERVKAARLKGHAYAETGLVKGTSALAVPVMGPGREALAAISVAAIADRLPPGRAAAVAVQVRAQAELVSRRLAAMVRRRPPTVRGYGATITSGEFE